MVSAPMRACEVIEVNRYTFRPYAERDTCRQNCRRPPRQPPGVDHGRPAEMPARSGGVSPHCGPTFVQKRERRTMNEMIAEALEDLFRMYAAD